ncbi:transmembrane protease serine 3 [Elysia marginata]|uniref:Transmembrane protease serine 3 n=1 Tax=Elysia marginata TaxID=1093978 RepID=A0AAV4GX87_9GAST|nr:transmembrane protease serine 3 [Elysia marginata]
MHSELLSVTVLVVVSVQLASAIRDPGCLRRCLSQQVSCSNSCQNFIFGPEVCHTMCSNWAIRCQTSCPNVPVDGSNTASRFNVLARINCVSVFSNGQLLQCPLPQATPGMNLMLVISRKLSMFDCIQGVNYGLAPDNSYIWTSGGCSAEFSVVSRPSGPSQQQPLPLSPLQPQQQGQGNPDPRPPLPQQTAQLPHSQSNHNQFDHYHHHNSNQLNNNHNNQLNHYSHHNNNQINHNHNQFNAHHHNNHNQFSHYHLHNSNQLNHNHLNSYRHHNNNPLNHFHHNNQCNHHHLNNHQPNNNLPNHNNNCPNNQLNLNNRSKTHLNRNRQPPGRNGENAVRHATKAGRPGESLSVKRPQPPVNSQAGGQGSGSLGNRATCGRANFNRVVGGTHAGRCEYPWMVLIYNQVSHKICGGSIIGKRHILTASHCFFGKNERTGQYEKSRATHLLVFSGSSTMPLENNPVERGLKRNYVAEIITHPEYRPSNARNDVAILRLRRDLPEDDCHRRVCLVSGRENPQQSRGCRTMGWGKISNHPDAQAVSRMRWAGVKISKDEKCRAIYGPSTATESTLCAGGRNSDSCSGDSGGPLVCLGSGGAFYQHGIVSLGLEGQCGAVDGLYTRVSTYLPWIGANTA